MKNIMMLIVGCLMLVSFSSYSSCDFDEATQAISQDIHFVFSTGDFSIKSLKISNDDPQFIEFSSEVEVCYNGELLNVTYNVVLADIIHQCLVDSVNPIASQVIGHCQ